MFSSSELTFPICLIAKKKKISSTEVLQMNLEKTQEPLKANLKTLNRDQNIKREWDNGRE